MAFHWVRMQWHFHCERSPILCAPNCDAIDPLSHFHCWHFHDCFCSAIFCKCKKLREKKGLARSEEWREKRVRDGKGGKTFFHLNEYRFVQNGPIQVVTKYCNNHKWHFIIETRIDWTNYKAKYATWMAEPETVVVWHYIVCSQRNRECTNFSFGEQKAAAASRLCSQLLLLQCFSLPRTHTVSHPACKVTTNKWC